MSRNSWLSTLRGRYVTDVQWTEAHMLPNTLPGHRTASSVEMEPRLKRHCWQGGGDTPPSTVSSPGLNPEPAVFLQSGFPVLQIGETVHSRSLWQVERGYRYLGHSLDSNGSLSVQLGNHCLAQFIEISGGYHCPQKRFSL